MNKVYASAKEALAGVVADGQTLAVGGFGLCGIPEALIAALRDSGVRAERFWDAERKESGRGAHLRILCDGGDFVTEPEHRADSFLMDESQPDDAVLTAIRFEIARRGGPVTVNIPIDGI